MRIRVNAMCNVVTGDLSTAYRNTPQITVPGFRLRLSILEAEALARCLTEAANQARGAIGKGGPFYDYTLQAWTEDGKVLPCNHPLSMGDACCNGRKYAGLTVDEARAKDAR